MIPLAPTELPLLRDRLIPQATSDVAKILIHGEIERGALGGRSDRPAAESAADYAEAEGRALAAAELFHVSREMVELASSSSDTLPRFSLAPEDLPAPVGLMYFASPILETQTGGSVASIWAASWYVCPCGTDALFRRYYSPKERLGESWESVRVKFPAPLFGFCGGSVTFGSGPVEVRDEAGVRSGAEGLGGARFAMILVSLWLLAGQPLAADDKVLTGRPRGAGSGRQQKRQSVRVISLRRPASEKSTGESDREWQHRWMVRGHWRMQPWGPKRERVRPVWIAPHIKGPEGKPLIGGEKVYALRR